MSGNAVIDVGIGLILMYLLLSLACTTINELLSTLVGLRSKTLQTGMARLLDDEQLKAAFYDHGLISGTCAVAGNKHPSYLSGRTFALALMGSVDPTQPLPGFDDIRQAVSNMPDSNIRDMLLSQITNAQGNLSRLRDGLSICFDQAMDHVSGIYKRQLKWLSLIIAVAITLACNADSFIVANRLWADGTLRAQLVQTAQSIETASSPQGADLDYHLQQMSHIEESTRPLPLGWSTAEKYTGENSNQILHVFSRIWGLLLTAIAVSLGAPFWFDLLGKFVAIRGTGGRPDRTEPGKQA